jgi:hypothetical protein
LPHRSRSVIEVLEKPGEDRAGSAGSRVALGQTASGRYLRVIYVPDRAGQRVRDHFLRAYREASCGVSQAQKEETSMSQSKFPDAWDEDKVQRVLAHYEEQTEDEALAEDEAGIQPSETVMNVPHDLVPKVRELIARQHS